MCVKKNCVSCGKQIPSVALVCVFCSTRQPAPSLDEADDLVSLTATEPTMVGFKLSDLSGAPHELSDRDPTAPMSPGSNGATSRPTGIVPALEDTQSMSMPSLSTPAEPDASATAAATATAEAATSLDDV